MRLLAEDTSAKSWTYHPRQDRKPKLDVKLVSLDQLRQGLWDQTALNCAARPETSARITPTSGDRYYLIVPTNGSIEGSYGVGTDGFERPASTAECATQRLGLCP